jgi:hypothetical protein
MAAAYDYARFDGFFGGAFKNIAENMVGKRSRRKPHNIKRKKRNAAHSVNIGYGVSRRDTPEQQSVIDYRREKISGKDDRTLAVNFINSGVIAIIKADKKVFVEFNRQVFY